jgi:hypothetical protein
MGPWLRVKRHIEETQFSTEFQSVGEILRRMRRECESEIANEFSPSLSVRLDLCLALEQEIEEQRW